MAQTDTIQFDGYRVLNTLGTGAASTIYEVVDIVDGKRYALKHLFKRSSRDQRYVDQAVNEHDIASQLHHSALRRSHKLIRRRSMLRTTQVQLLMEYVDGQTLAVLRPTCMVTLINIFKTVTDALNHMHGAGVIHADVKPINILINRDQGVKVIDFGQSCETGTVKDRIQGTLDYIAPEQIHQGPITPATDVYNLGATMYWCVTGRHVPGSPRKRSQMSKFSIDVPVKLPSPHDQNPDCPPAMSNLILECLRRDPAQRPFAMDQVKARLDMAVNQVLRQKTSA